MFSFLTGRKKSQSKPTEEDELPQKRGSGKRLRQTLNPDTEAQRATVQKIDAIESEMVRSFLSEGHTSFTKTNATAVTQTTEIHNAEKEAEGASSTTPNTTPHIKGTVETSLLDISTVDVTTTVLPTNSDFSATQMVQTQVRGSRKKSGRKTETFEHTLPLMELTTQFLRKDKNQDTIASQLLISVADVPPLIEEAAVLFAKGDTAKTEAVLEQALGQPGNAHQQTGWQMLLDLFQLLNKSTEFASLAQNYAKRFKCPQPMWNQQAAQLEAHAAEIVPQFVFEGVIDADSMLVLKQIKLTAASSRKLRLEFDQITAIDSIGCRILLRIFASFSQSGHEISLSGVRHLTRILQATIRNGRREDTESPWLVLMELYRWSGRQSEFEIIARSFSLTFSLPAPAWVPLVAADNAHALIAEEAEIDVTAEIFALKGVLDARAHNVLAKLNEWAQLHTTLHIDCTQLVRVDFGMAGKLLNALFSLHAQGKNIHFTEVNHLVAALFHVVGIKELAAVQVRPFLIAA